MKNIQASRQLFHPRANVATACRYPAGVQNEGGGGGVKSLIEVIHERLVAINAQKFEVVVVVGQAHAFLCVKLGTLVELIDKLHYKIDEFRDAELTEDSNMSLGVWLDKWIAEYMTGTIRESTLGGYKTYTEKYIKDATQKQAIFCLYV